MYSFTRDVSTLTTNTNFESFSLTIDDKVKKSFSMIYYKKGAVDAQGYFIPKEI